MAPFAKLKFSLGTINSGSIYKLAPKPPQCGQAPCGLLNENRRGSISSMVNPETGQANFEEKVSRDLSAIFSTYKIPLLSLSAVSTDCAKRVAIPSFIISLSTTTSILCLLFLFKFGSSSIL